MYVTGHHRWQAGQASKGSVWSTSWQTVCVLCGRFEHACSRSIRSPASHWAAPTIHGPQRMVWQEGYRWGNLAVPVSCNSNHQLVKKDGISLLANFKLLPWTCSIFDLHSTSKSYSIIAWIIKTILNILHICLYENACMFIMTPESGLGGHHTQYWHFFTSI